MPTVAYRVTRRRRAFVNAPRVRQVLAQALDREVKPHFLDAFKAVVANWEHQPVFKARKYLSADAIKLTVFPSGPNKDIYRFVTGGTKPHPIPKVPKTKGTLAFMWGGPGSYQPKTQPVGKYGGPGRVLGGRMFYAKQVQHPGTKARNFEKAIREQEAKWFARTMENAWRRAIRAMNK